MNSCHLTIKWNPKGDNRQNGGYKINFLEDTTIAKPQFIKDSSLEHTIRSRWTTPCRVLLSSMDMNNNENCYNAYYHPLAYQLIKNGEFKRIIIENAIESICHKTKMVSDYNYDVLPTKSDSNENLTFTTPSHSMSIFSSNFNQKFIQLFVWVPLIISSKSIIFEISESNFYLQTEKPYKYELDLKLPEFVKISDICFCNFLKKEKKIVFVAKYIDPFQNDVENNAENLYPLNEFHDKENRHPLNDNQPISLSNEKSLVKLIDNKDIMCEIYNSNSNECETSDLRDSIIFNISEVPTKNSDIQKNQKNEKPRVRFNSTNSCLIFFDTKPPIDVSDKPGHKVAMKTKDGCSAKKYTYRMYKNRTNNSDKANKSKRSGSKKKK